MKTREAVDILFKMATDSKSIQLHLQAIQHANDINFQDAEGNTLLIIAARKGYLDMVEILLETKCDLYLRNKRGCTAFWYAAINNHLDILLILTKAGYRNLNEDIGLSKGILQKRKEMENVENLEEEIIDKSEILHIIKADCDLDIQDIDCVMFNTEIPMSLAINMSIFKHWQNSLGYQIIHTLYDVPDREQRLKIVRALIKAKANVNFIIGENLTALMLASHKNQFEIAQALIEAKANINQKLDSTTAFDFALFEKHSSILNLLINHEVTITNPLYFLDFLYSDSYNKEQPDFWRGLNTLTKQYPLDAVISRKPFFDLKTQKHHDDLRYECIKKNTSFPSVLIPIIQDYESPSASFTRFFQSEPKKLTEKDFFSEPSHICQIL
jgi:ankyrin repeat protein